MLPRNMTREQIFSSASNHSIKEEKQSHQKTPCALGINMTKKQIFSSASNHSIKEEEQSHQKTPSSALCSTCDSNASHLAKVCSKFMKF
jgi:hypothetical protein